MNDGRQYRNVTPTVARQKLSRGLPTARARRPDATDALEPAQIEPEPGAVAQHADRAAPEVQGGHVAVDGKFDLVKSLLTASIQPTPADEVRAQRLPASTTAVRRG